MKYGKIWNWSWSDKNVIQHQTAYVNFENDTAAKEIFCSTKYVVQYAAVLQSLPYYDTVSNVKDSLCEKNLNALRFESQKGEMMMIM